MNSRQGRISDTNALSSSGLHRHDKVVVQNADCVVMSIQVIVNLNFERLLSIIASTVAVESMLITDYGTSCCSALLLKLVVSAPKEREGGCGLGLGQHTSGVIGCGVHELVIIDLLGRDTVR